MRKQSIGLLVICALVAMGAPDFTPAHAAETLVAPERNPPGDIPDSQVFITYSGKGFSLQVPEGWARSDLPNGARFADKYGAVEVRTGATSGAVTGDVAALMQDAPGAKVTKTEAIKITAGPALRISYLANSAANPVTGKKILLENQRYVIRASGRVALLDLSAPAGADNVDQWQLMSNSFRWK